MRLLTALLALLVLAPIAADAARHHRHTVIPAVLCRPSPNPTIMCDTSPEPGNFLAGVRSIDVEMHKVTPHGYRQHRTPQDVPQASLGGRPAGCPHAWCGCWLAMERGLRNAALNLAANWARIGHDAGGPQVGAVVVWPHHVGEITAVEGNRIKVRSGNDGNAVRERWRPTAGVIAYRWVSSS